MLSYLLTFGNTIFMYTSITVLFFIIVSVVVQEMGRVFWAEQVDASGKQKMMRYSQNPLKYIDLWGTLLIPTVSYLAAGIFVGFAKQHMILISHFRYGILGKYTFLSSRVLTSLLVAIFFSVIYRASSAMDILGSQVDLYALIVQVNVGLACFMLLPLPGFDGYQLLKEMSPRNLSFRLRELEAKPSALILSLLAVFFLIAPLISLLVKYIVLFLIG